MKPQDETDAAFNRLIRKHIKDSEATTRQDVTNLLLSMFASITADVVHIVGDPDGFLMLQSALGHLQARHSKSECLTGRVH